jgi:DNA polymerase V
MQVIDAINARMGRHAIVTAAQGFVQPTAMRHDYCSDRYTTCWDELANVI